MTQALHDARYFALRLIRKWLFPTAIPARVARFIPGMGVSYGTTTGAGVFGIYDGQLAPLEPEWLVGKTVLDLGCGETNSCAYEMAAHGASFCYAVEPFVRVDHGLDRRALNVSSAAHGIPAAHLATKVERKETLSSVPANTVDWVVSNSVLEHVSDLGTLCQELKTVLRPGGRMLHAVDYRDHYFRYPYNHLLWSKSTWERYLNPGDLPRWRIGDHAAAFARCGWRVTVLKATKIPAAFEFVRGRIHPEFSHYALQDLETALGVLLCSDE